MTQDIEKTTQSNDSPPDPGYGDGGLLSKEWAKARIAELDRQIWQTFVMSSADEEEAVFAILKYHEDRTIRGHGVGKKTAVMD
jgi:hypothetical protein